MNDPIKDNSFWHFIIIVVGLVMFWLGILAGLELAEVDKIIII